MVAALAPSPVARLNRAIAIGMRDGPRAGLAELEALASEPALAAYSLLPGTAGALWLRAGDGARAPACFREALARPYSGPERRFLGRELRRAEAPSVASRAPAHVAAKVP